MYYHILFNCPRLGLYKQADNERVVMEQMRADIVKQLSEMTLDKFKKYCEIREYKVDVHDEKGSIPF